MKLRRIESAQEYLNLAGNFLEQKEAENNLILGLAISIAEGKSRYTDYYFAVIENDTGQVISAVMRTPPHQLLFAYPFIESGIDPVIDDAIAVWGDTLSGVQADPVIAKQFAKKWHNRTGRHYRLGMNQRMYRLDDVIPGTSVSGRLRPMEERDREIVGQWFLEFNEEALNYQPDDEVIKRILDEALDPNHPRRYHIWENAGEPVSLVGSGGMSKNGARVGPVYTPPDKRKQGYASAAVAEFSQYLLDTGLTYCMLFTDLDNPTSNHIYQEIGYRPMVDVNVYYFS